jgi:hypothetical protein
MLLHAPAGLPRLLLREFTLYCKVIFFAKKVAPNQQGVANARRLVPEGDA